MAVLRIIAFSLHDIKEESSAPTRFLGSGMAAFSLEIKS